MRNIAWVVIGVFLLGVFGLYGQPAGLINRRVLILDFVNQKKSKNTDYLSASIAEGFIPPLQQTKSFEILGRDQGKEATRQENISADDLYSEANAVKLGKRCGAEVVLMGTFLDLGSSVRIQASAIEVHSGRSRVNRIVTAKLDGSLFGNIDRLAKDMSEEMKRELPPLPLREITVYRDAKGSEVPAAKEEDNRGLQPGNWFFEISAGMGISDKILESYVTPLGFYYYDNPWGLPTGRFAIGKSVSRQFNVGLTGNFAFESKSQVPGQDPKSQVTQTYTGRKIDAAALVQWFPFSRGFVLLSTLGYSNAYFTAKQTTGSNAVNFAGATYSGLRATGGLGYYLWLGKSFTAGIFLEGGINTYDTAAREVRLFLTVGWF